MNASEEKLAEVIHASLCSYCDPEVGTGLTIRHADLEKVVKAIVGSGWAPRQPRSRALNKDMIHALSKDLTHASSMIDQDRYISIPVWLYKPFAEQLFKMGWRKRAARRKDPEGDPS